MYEELSDSLLNCWFCLLYGNLEVNYKGYLVVDFLSSYDLKRREFNFVMEKKCVNLDGKRDYGRCLNYFVWMLRYLVCGDEFVFLNMEVRVGYFFLICDILDVGIFGYGFWGNNLYCIFDVINFIEKK